MYIALVLKAHSCPWFSAASSAAVGPKNRFLCYYQKKSVSKAKFRQAIYRCKRTLEAGKLAYCIKRRESTSAVLNKGKYILCLMVL